MNQLDLEKLVKGDPKLISFKELLDLHSAGKLPKGRVMMDGGWWVYLTESEEDQTELAIDITESGLREVLDVCGIKWEII